MSDELDREMFRFILEVGAKTINAALLINGGAATATLALMPTAIEHGYLIGFAIAGLMIFAVGVLSAVASFAMTYLAQSRFYHRPSGSTAGDNLRTSAIYFTAISCAMFFTGCIAWAVSIALRSGA